MIFLVSKLASLDFQATYISRFDYTIQATFVVCLYIEGLPPMPPTPAIWRRRSKVKRCMFQYKQSNGEIGAA